MAIGMQARVRHHVVNSRGCARMPGMRASTIRGMEARGMEGTWAMDIGMTTVVPRVEGDVGHGRGHGETRSPVQSLDEEEQEEEGVDVREAEIEMLIEMVQEGGLGTCMITRVVVKLGAVDGVGAIVVDR
jgi:hypothetical protein